MDFWKLVRSGRGLPVSAEESTALLWSNLTQAAEAFSLVLNLRLSLSWEQLNAPLFFECRPHSHEYSEKLKRGQLECVEERQRRLCGKFTETTAGCEGEVL